MLKHRRLLIAKLLKPKIENMKIFTLKPKKRTHIGKLSSATVFARLWSWSLNGGHNNLSLKTSLL